jgi:replicative DNA helicase
MESTLQDSNPATTQPSKVKMLPHSLEAEQSVLGALMLVPEAWDAIAGILSEQDFYRRQHQAIFQVMVILAEKGDPFDVLTVSEALKVRDALGNAGGEAYLFELANNTPSTANIASYAAIVRERSILRQLISVSNGIANMALLPEGRSCHDIVEAAETEIFRISDQDVRGNEPIQISQFLAQATERIDTLYRAKGQLAGTATGFTDLDKMTAGMHAGDLIIVAGRPSMGKTAFSMNIAENVAIKTDKISLVFSMEMSGDSLALRMLSSLGRIDQNRVRTGQLSDDDWPRITSSVSMLSESKMFIDDTPALSPTEVRARVRRVIKQHGEIGVIVVDYLQLMQVPGIKDNRTLEISEISRSLKGIAKEAGVPVVALSQLNRGLEQRPDKRPIMSDLRESGAIEQDADLILFIYRDEVYNPESAEKGSAEVIIAKHRNGPTGKVRLAFLGKYTRFENYSAGLQGGEAF